MTTIALMHGWGYDARLWDEVRARLDPALEVIALDLGFYGAATPATAWPEPVIAVGHSLGALWWLTQATQSWRRLLCINGFPRFTATSGYAAGVPARTLARMRRQFAREPLRVLAEFHARCGAHAPAAAPDIARLATGLDWLAAWDGRATLARRRQDVFALAGRHDPIVPAAMSAMAFDAVEFIDDAGHLLPVTHPEACARWIERLADE